jgi:hypothetical protein
MEATFATEAQSSPTLIMVHLGNRPEGCSNCMPFLFELPIVINLVVLLWFILVSCMQVFRAAYCVDGQFRQK